MKPQHERVLFRSAIPLALLLTLLVLLIAPVSGREENDASNVQEAEPVDTGQEALDRLQDDSGGQAIVSHNAATGVASFVRLPRDGDLALTAGLSVEAEAWAFLQTYGAVFGVQDPDRQLQLVGERRNVAGQTQLTYKQVHEGVDVFAGMLRVQLDGNNRVVSANGAFVPGIKVDATPSLAAEMVVTRALAHVQQQMGIENASTDLAGLNTHLYLFRDGLVQRVAGDVRLVYEVEVANSDITVREFVYVDAHSGAIVEQITGIHNDLDREVSETTLANVVWQEGDDDPIPPGWAMGSADQIAAWQDEIDGAAETYYLFESMADRDSYDGSGATMRTVNNDPNISCPNANWNGTSTNYCNDVTGDDTVAHEWGHAYTEYTNGLIYQWQSGALNESYSDIWGEVVDLLNGRGLDAPDVVRDAGYCSSNAEGANFPGNPTADTVRWLSGEDDPAFDNIPTGSGNAIRDMWDPTCFGDPGKVTDTDEYVCSTDDSGGVHTNSGVPNHAFALMVDGGTYNGETVTGIGLTKAAHIHWEAQNMLTPSSNFVDHADALEAACTVLTGVNLPALSTSDPDPGPSGQTITAGDCQEVADAIAAVEFRTEPAFCEFEPLLEKDEPALCEGLGDLESVFSEDWEGGSLPAGWTVGTHDVANPPTFDTPNWDVVGGLPDGANGTYAAFVADLIIGNCADDDETGALYLDSPVISIPAHAGVARVAFDHWVATELGWDGGNVKVSVNGGDWMLLPASAFEYNPYNISLNTAGVGNTNPLAGEASFSGTDGGTVSGSWGQSQVNLTGIAAPGDEVQFRFDFGLDGCNGVIGWYVDDVQVYSCSAELAPAAIDVNADPLSSTLAVGQTISHTVAISNTGGADLDWTIDESAPPPAASGGSPLRTIPDSIAAPETLTRDFEAAPLVDVISDGGFEEGSPNPYWDEHSDNFGTPLCTVGLCGTGGGTGPHSGSWWTWFGGIDGNESGYVSQDVIIPEGAAALSFWLEISSASGTGNDFMDVSIDGNEIFSVTDADAGDYATYTQVNLDINAYADGASHTVRFDSTVAGGGVTNFFVDDVVLDSLVGCDAPSDISWASVSPVSGTTAGGATSTVDVTFDATGLAEGVYNGTLCINSNDTLTPRVEVPIELTVVDEWYNYLPAIFRP